MDKNKIVLDLETKKTFDEVGGQHNRCDLGVSLVGIYDYQTAQLKAFREEDFPELERILERKPQIIGFNVKSFDLEVIKPYFKKINFDELPYLDLLEEVTKVLGHRLKLESLVRATLGEGKSGQGLDAIYYFRDGDWSSLERYCLDDVRLTKELYEYGQKQGQLYFINAGDLQSIPVSWAREKRIKDLLEEALYHHDRIEIEYLDFSLESLSAGDPVIRTSQRIDIQDMVSDKIKAYSHLKKEDVIFEIRKIVAVKKIGETAIHQDRLI